MALCLLLLRLAYAPVVNLFPEEAYYWNYSEHLDFGYLDHPPMVAWLIHAGTAFFGKTEFGIRAGAVLCSLVTAFFAWRLTALLYGKRAAGMAVLLLALLPFTFMTGWVMTPDAPLAAAWSAALYALARALLRGERRAWWGAGAAIGIGLLAKYTIALAGLATLVFVVLDPPSRRWLRQATPYGAGLLAFAIFSPVIYWNAIHHWASFGFQSADRLKGGTHFSLHELLGSILALLTPAGCWLAGRALLQSREEVTNEAARRLLFERVFALVPLAVFIVFACRHPVKLNWTGPLWLALIPSMAAQLAAAAALPLGLRTAWRVTAVLLAGAWLGLLQYLSFGLPGVPYASNTALLPVGWKVLSQDLERQKHDLESAGTGRVLLVGMDRNFLASEAAFYASDQTKGVRETTGAHLFHRPSLMYAYWFPVAEQDGATLLLVSFEQASLEHPRVQKYGGTLDPIRKCLLEVKGKPVRAYFTRVAHDYQSKGHG